MRLHWLFCPIMKPFETFHPKAVKCIISPSLSLSDLSVPGLPSLVAYLYELFTSGNSISPEAEILTEANVVQPRFTEVLIALVYYAINFPELSECTTLHRCSAIALHALISHLPPSIYPCVLPPPGLIAD